MAEIPADPAPSSVLAPETIPLPGEFEALCERLVADPRLITTDPKKLAAETGLPPDFVADVQAAMQIRSAVESSGFNLWLVIREAGFALLEQLKRMRGSWDRHSLVWLLGSTLCFGVLFTIKELAGPNDVLWTVSQNAMLASLVAMIICHVGIWLVRGMARFAVYAGAALAFAFLTAGLIVQQLTGDSIDLVAVSAVVIGIFYTVLGLMFSVVGGYRRLRREARSEISTRQEILGRLFDVEAMLARHDPARMTGDAPAWYTRLRRGPAILVAAVAVGLGVGILDVSVQVLIYRANGESLFSMLENPSMTMLIYGLASIPFTIGSYLLLAFLAGTFLRGVGAALLFYIAHVLCYLLPVEPLGREAFRTFLSPERQWPGFIVVVVCALSGALAAQIETLLTQRRRRQGRSPAALLAERVTLQRRLNLGRQATCVLVVDVARSTKMKEGADPLKVEWSFREYQAMVAAVATTHGGEVLSTAGDGAVLLFARARDAVQAARRIQTEIGSFNQRRNRMSQPFRLRIGLHLGETASDLAQAPFHEVIDKSAHIESVAPIGGIALSARVAAEVPELAVVALANRIDDEEVMVVLNPTLDPDAE